MRSPAVAALVSLAVVLWACPRPGTDMPDPVAERSEPEPSEPAIAAEVTSSPISAVPTVPLAPADGREVELRVNGEALRVVRPSLANPFVVAGAEFEQNEPTTLRTPASSEGPRVAHVQQRVIDVIRGVPQSVQLQVTDPDGMGDVIGYYVQYQGYDGYFFVPTAIDSEVFGAADRERGQTTIHFFMDEVFPPGAQRDAQWVERYREPFEVQMLVWAVDRARHVSAPVAQTLNVLPVGRGDLEVTLSMALPSDLDLYVVEPNGNVIYYSNMRSWTNGQLDLDANAACNSNRNVRYEHIFWPEGQVPEGTYQVRVDNWANCVGGQPVDFEVVIQNCGDISVFEGQAVGPGGRNDCVNGSARSCQHMASVEVRPCQQPANSTVRAPR